jgi:hypothetical protein
MRSDQFSDVGADDSRDEVPLAELMAALSLGFDLGFSQPMEHVLRQCILALRLCACLGLPAEAHAKPAVCSTPVACSTPTGPTRRSAHPRTSGANE